MKRIDPKNLTAQLLHRAAGNPPSTLPDSAISNCYPGLEFDFRNLWRRIFEGIELHEADNYVVRGEGEYERLKGRRLLRVAEQPIVVKVAGPQSPGGSPVPLTSGINPEGVWAMEWSNVLAKVLHENAGRMVTCEFTLEQEPLPVGLTDANGQPRELEAVQLRIRPLFAWSELALSNLPVIEEQLVRPGELTQSLCSPWQNDYRECACYYWASSRPDYVNTELDERGVSVGNNWMSVDRVPKEYVLDNREDSRLVTYDDLFQDWQGKLRFIIGGKDGE
ncbi:hypothetical protein F0U61_28300 [Archangium violaceum]|uniref:hypothetical protein n=1 Tax=Archangium violaceum TaxID=83451 RepID=UPI002B29CA59|nr:hypothetical protein F0U61_28300 [Archangium violaceum]